MDDSSVETCYKCKLTGHRAKDCPTKLNKKSNITNNTTLNQDISQNNAKSSETEVKSTDICYRCKESGHLASKCPTKQKNKQPPSKDSQFHIINPSTNNINSNNNNLNNNNVEMKINEENHTKTNDVSSTDVCYKCLNSGHRAKDCPLKHKTQSNTIITTNNNNNNNTKPNSESTNELSCYKCKRIGHISKDCPLKKRKNSTHSNDIIKTTNTHNTNNISTISNNKPDNKRMKPSSDSSISENQRVRALKLCGRCGSSEHLAVDCKQEKQCFHCKSKEHLGKDCPNHKIELKPCYLCQSTTHISRYCPTLQHRIIYRNEEKQRGENCYICKKQGHHAVECPELGTLYRDYTIFIENSTKFNTNTMNLLLQLTCRALEYKAAIYLYQYMIQNQINITEPSYIALLQLHEASGKPQTQIATKFNSVNSIEKPKKQLKNIILQYKYTIAKPTQYNNTLQTVVNWLKQNLEQIINIKGRIELAKIIGNSVKLSSKLSREIVKLLIDEYYIFEYNNGKLLLDLELKGEVKQLQLEKQAKKQNNKKNSANSMKSSSKLKKKTNTTAVIANTSNDNINKDSLNKQKEVKDNHKKRKLEENKTESKSESNTVKLEHNDRKLINSTETISESINNTTTPHDNNNRKIQMKAEKQTNSNIKSEITNSADICYRCKESGHFASKCPLKKQKKES